MTARSSGIGEDDYDRQRLPGAYSQTIHHIRGLKKELDTLRSRGRAGDRFRAAKVSWYIRNNESYARRLQERAAQLGVDGCGSRDAAVCQSTPLLAQMELFA